MRLLVLLVLLHAPARAFALCPNCLGQTRGGTPTIELLGVFLVVPFVVAYLVFRTIRRLTARADSTPAD